KGTEGTLQLALSDDQMDQYDLLTTAQQRAFVRTLGLPAGYNLDKRGVNPVSSTDTDPDDFSSLRIQAGDSGKDVRRGLSGQAAENLGRNRDLLALGRDQDDEARVVVERARGNSDVYAAALVIAAQRGKEGYTDPFDVIKAANGDLAAIQEAFGERTKGIAGDVSRLDIARDIIAEKLGIEGDRLDGGVLADQFAERLAETIGRRTQIQELNHLLTLPRQTVDGQPEAFDAWTGRIKDGLRSLGVDPTKVDSLVDAIHQPEVVPAEGNAVISGIAREVMSAHAASEDPRALRDRLLADIQNQVDAGTLTGDDLAEARRAVDEFAPEPVAAPSQTELFGSTMRNVMGAASAEEAFAILSSVEGQLDPADAAIIRGQVDAKRPPVPEQPDQALVDAAVNLLARQLGISEEAARAMLRNQAQTTGGGTAS
ncbi:MAG TPA: ANTAR domain-containing protein, partial [Patescibacteria group bacterium]|nr:ANTAR domain-containing protein [Patescibacteria group bacterium]